MNQSVAVANFYKFFSVSEAVAGAGGSVSGGSGPVDANPVEAGRESPELHRIADDLEQRGESLGLLGLIILASEGLNGTVAGTPEAVAEFKEQLATYFSRSDFTYKDGFAETNPFKHFRVKIRPEIVTTGHEERLEVGEATNKVSPAEWHQMLDRDDVVLVDVRNDYETEIGMFRNAIDPKTKNFQEFSEYVRRTDWPKDQTVMMYCTGGIRCEKASLAMQKLGYQAVYQLDGGILNYLKEFPDGKFDGECFVFDNRVALDRQLKPTTRYSFCPHCGNPASIDISCLRCDKTAKICTVCEQDRFRQTCSKDCAYQLKRKVANSSHA